MDRGGVGQFILLAIVGAVAGSVLGEIIAQMVPALGFLTKVGTQRIGFDLSVVDFHFQFNLAAIIGAVAAILAFRRL